MIALLRRPVAERRRDETFAWSCLVTNLLGVPGLGTLAAGDLGGIGQLALAVVGGVLLTWWLIAFASAALEAGGLPLDTGPGLRAPVAGILLFGAGWLWSLGSSVALLREARRAGNAPPSVPPEARWSR